MLLTYIPKDMCREIIEYAINSYYTLEDWIDIDKLSWKGLSRNVEAIDLLTENQDKIDWNELSINSNAIKLIKDNLDKVCWSNIFENPGAIDIIKDNLHRLDEIYGTTIIGTTYTGWHCLSSNIAAGDILKKKIAETPHRLYWGALSRNPIIFTEDILLTNRNRIWWKQMNANPAAVEFLKSNSDEIYWDMLPCNPNAIELIKDQIMKESKGAYKEFNWYMLSSNPNHEALNILKTNPDKIYWNTLLSNPSAIELIKEKIDSDGYESHIHWENLSENPAIFKDNKSNIINRIINALH